MAVAASWREDAIILAGLGLAWATLWLLTIPVGDIPLNDDWVYALAVRSLLETGRYTLPSPVNANVIAQIYWGALFCLPFGFSFEALRVSTFALGAAGVLAIYLFLRELGADRKLACVGALTLAVNPIYLSQATTFMTDVPFTALVVLSLWLYLRGVRRESTAAMVGAFALGYVALMVRQFGLMLPVAFGAAHVVRRGLRLRPLVVAALPVLLGVALHLTYEKWVLWTGRAPLLFSPVDTMVPHEWGRFLKGAASVVATTPLYLGLFLLPVAAGGVGAITGLRPRTLLAGGLLAGALAWLAVKGALLPVIGNVLAPFGIGPLTVTDRYLRKVNLPALPIGFHMAWVGVTAASAFAIGVLTVVLAAMLFRTFGAAWRSSDLRAWWPQAMLLVLMAVYTAGLFVIDYQAGFWLDRYLILFLPPMLGLFVLSRGAVFRTVPAAAVLAAFAVFSVLGTHDYLAWNRARWAALAALEAKGVSPRQIDGGYEYNGWRLHDVNYRPRPPKARWWVEDDQYMIASGPLPGYRQIAAVPFERWLVPGPAEVVTLERE